MIYEEKNQIINISYKVPLPKFFILENDEKHYSVLICEMKIIILTTQDKNGGLSEQIHWKLSANAQNTARFKKGNKDHICEILFQLSNYFRLSELLDGKMTFEIITSFIHQGHSS